MRFGWTFDERLVVLNEEGAYRLYDLQGDYQQFSLGNEAAELGIIDARIHENGLVALTGSLTLLEVKEWEGGRPLTLAAPGMSLLSILWVWHVRLFIRVIGTPSCLGCYTSGTLDIETC